MPVQQQLEIQQHPGPGDEQGKFCLWCRYQAYQYDMSLSINTSS